MTSPPIEKLTRREREIMDALFALEDGASAEDVRQRLTDPPGYSAVRAMLVRLEAKGYVRHRVEGRTNVYSGIEQPSNVAAKAVRQIIDRLCDGSVEQLLVGMVDNEVIDKRDLASLARKIAKRKKGEAV